MWSNTVDIISNTCVGMICPPILYNRNWGGHISIASVCMPCSLVPIYTLLPSPDENFPQLDIVEVYPFSGKGAWTAAFCGDFPTQDQKSACISAGNRINRIMLHDSEVSYSDENGYIRNSMQLAQYASLQFVESAYFLRNEKTKLTERKYCGILWPWPNRNYTGEVRWRNSKMSLRNPKRTTAHVDDLAVVQELRRKNAILPHK